MVKIRTLEVSLNIFESIERKKRNVLIIASRRKVYIGDKVRLKTAVGTVNNRNRNAKFRYITVWVINKIMVDSKCVAIIISCD